MLTYLFLHLQVADVGYVPAELVAMANNPLLFNVVVDAAHDNMAEKVYEVKQMTADSKLVHEFAVFFNIGQAMQGAPFVEEDNF